MLKKIYVAFFAMILVLSLSACGGSNNDNNNNAGSNNTSTGSVDATAANDVFQKNCASCHGNNLQGNVGPNLQKIGSKLSKDAILKQIKNGGGGMPAGIISGKDADLVATWLASKK